MKSEIPTLRKKILSWYSKNKRSLPWRQNKNPYRIWISEIMLQQTQVVTVIPYYKRWMKSFPTISSLAKAPLDKVLKHWEGLGYYSRARNIHKTAKEIVSNHKGKFPKEFDEILKLPGIGRYSAGAITSIAFDAPNPVLDGNVIRVITRLFAVKENVSDQKVINKLWKKSEELLSPRNPGDFNQAMMEIGALICTPTSPLCTKCPLKRNCKAHLKGKEESFPVKTKIQYEKMDVAIGIIRRKGKILIQKRPLKSRMGGLWEFPGGKLEKDEKPETGLVRELREELDVQIKVGKKYQTIRHAYTRFRVTLHPFECTIKKGNPKPISSSELNWISPSKLIDYAFPSANKKLIPELIKN